MNDIKRLWEERSKKYGRDFRGVLPKSFPSWLNMILHKWMYSQIRYKILNTNGEDGYSYQILDLGCGYGRIAKEVLNDFPKDRVYGVDISKNYVDIFNKDLTPRAHGKVADIKKLPFGSNYFDMVYMITTLMYITNNKEQETAMKEIFRVLKSKGQFVFIERNPIGHFLFTFGGIITKLRGKKHKEIDSVSFKEDQIGRLVHLAGGRVQQKSGFPFGSLLTPSLYISYSGIKL